MEIEKTFKTTLMLLKNGQYKSALNVLAEIKKENRNNALVWVFEGIALNYLGRFYEALFIHGHVDRMQVKRLDGLDEKQTKLKISTLYNQTVEICDVEIDKHNNSAANWHAKGCVLKNFGRYPEALTSFSRAITLDPGFVYSWNCIGLIQLELKSNSDALKSFEKAISLDSNFAFPWNNKGTILDRMGKSKEAIDAYDEAIRLDPKFAFPWSNKGTVLEKLGYDEEALDAYEHAISLEQECAGWTGKGVLLEKMERYDDALDAYDKANGLDATEVTPLNNKASLLNKMARYDKAIEVCDQIINLSKVINKRNSIVSLTWIIKGESLKFKRHHLEALQAFENSIELDSNNSEAWNGKGMVLNGLGRYYDALHAYERAIDLNKKSGVIWNNKGVCLSKIGRYDEALLAYNKAINLDAKLAQPWAGKGEIYSSIPEFEDIEDAKRCFLRAYYLLGKDRYNYDVFNQIVSTFVTRYIGPLFIQKIFMEHPYLCNEPNFEWSIEFAFLKDNSKLLDLIQWIDATEFDEKEKLKILGLIYYYWGDPFTAIEKFKKANSINNVDLLCEYYIILSRNAFFEPVVNELEIAAKLAKNLLGFNESEIMHEQAYYGAMILLLSESKQNIISAERLISELDDSIEKTYLKLLLSKENNYDNEELLIKILESEKRIIMGKGSGLLLSIPENGFELGRNIAGLLEKKTNINVSEDKLVNSLRDDLFRFAHVKELSDAIEEVEAYLDEYDEKAENKNGIKLEAKPIDQNIAFFVSRRGKSNFESDQICKIHASLNRYLEIQTQKTTNISENRLLNEFEETFSQKYPLLQSSGEIEIYLADLISNNLESENEKRVFIVKLVAWNLKHFRISPFAALTLLLYYVVHSNKPKFLPDLDRVPEKSIEYGLIVMGLLLEGVTHIAELHILMKFSSALNHSYAYVTESNILKQMKDYTAFKKDFINSPLELKTFIEKFVTDFEKYSL